MAAGMTVVGICCVILSTISLHSSFWHMLPGFILGGVGMSFVMTPMSAAAMGAVPVDKAGVGSGVLNTFRQVGAAIGIALMGAILISKAGGLNEATRNPHAFMDGFKFGLEISAAICFGAAIAAATLVRRYRHAESSQPLEVAA
jgi:hypothetical protein